MEDQSGQGDFQGGNVDIFTPGDSAEWGGSMKDLLEKVHAKHSR
jgi:cobaltochelatase CobN